MPKYGMMSSISIEHCFFKMAAFGLDNLYNYEVHDYEKILP